MTIRRISLFLLIFAIHVGIIYIFFFNKDQGEVERETGKKEKNTVQKENKKRNPLDFNNRDDDKNGNKFSENSVKKYTNSKIGTHLSYKNARKGTIRELPNSKLATSGILVDMNSRRVLWSKKSRNPVPIASMTKMMTTLLALEAIEHNNKITLQTPIKVTRSASKIGGSQVWLDPKETFSLGELLKVISIHSANDAAELVAEFLGNGNSSNFVALMNKRARQLRMPSTQFYTPHGLNGRDRRNRNISSPEGLVFLAEHLLAYPKAIKWASTWRDKFREKSSKPMILINRNKLVEKRPKLGCPGVDGMKTGFIRASGYCITVTCKRNGKRLIGVVTGFKSGRTRNKFVKKLLDWGYKRN